MQQKHQLPLRQHMKYIPFLSIWTLLWGSGFGKRKLNKVYRCILIGIASPHKYPPVIRDGEWIKEEKKEKSC